MVLPRDVRRTLDALWGRGRGKILLAVAGGWFLSVGGRVIYPTLLPHLRLDFNLSLAEAGLLLTVLWFVYAIGQAPAGIFSDRFGERAALSISTGVSAVALIVVLFSSSTRILFAATAAFGLGTALYGVARFTVLSNIYTDRDGTAIGITMAAGDVGSGILPPAAGFLAAAFAWQYGFAFTVPLFAAMAVVLWITIPSRESSGQRPESAMSVASITSILSTLMTPTIFIVVVIQVLGLSIWQGFTGFFPTYLVERKGISSAVAATLFGMFFAMGIIVQPIVGNAYDRVGIKRSLPFVFGAMAISLCSLVFAEGLWELAVITLLLSSILTFPTITLTFLTNELPEGVEGTALGFLRSGYSMIGAVSPVVVGVFADQGYFDLAFLSLAILAGIAILVCFVIPTDS